MIRSIAICSAITVLVSFQGCATKTYGRQGSLTAYEKETMTCREIELDLAKTRGFVNHVDEESKFSGKDVLALLGDFGIGNHLEKNAMPKATINFQKEFLCLSSNSTYNSSCMLRSQSSLLSMQVPPKGEKVSLVCVFLN